MSVVFSCPVDFGGDRCEERNIGAWKEAVSEAGLDLTSLLASIVVKWLFVGRSLSISYLYCNVFIFGFKEVYTLYALMTFVC